MAEWVRALAWNGDQTFPAGYEPTAVKTFRLGTLGIPFATLCQCLSDETLKAVGHFILLSGVYERGSKISHQSALECVTVVDSTSHSKLSQKCVGLSLSMRLKTVPCTEKEEPSSLRIRSSSLPSYNYYYFREIQSQSRQALTLDCGNHWPRGPVNQKIHWPPKKPTGPPKTCNDQNVFAAGIYDFTREVAHFCTLGLYNEK